MFNRNKIDKDMITAIKPTSKSTLKMQCLMVANGDIDKAERLYDFMIKDMDDLPLFEPQQPTTMAQIKDGATSIFGWVNENQDNIAGWINIIRGMFSKNAPTAQVTTTPIPDING